MAGADDLAGVALAQQLHSQMAGFEGEGAVLGNGHAAALGVANDGGTHSQLIALVVITVGGALVQAEDVDALALQDGGQEAGVDLVVLTELLAAGIQVGVSVEGHHGIPAALSDDDGGAGVFLADLVAQALGDGLDVPLDLGHQHDLGAGSAGGLQGDVAAVTAHALDHVGTVVAAGGGADIADGLGADLHGGLVAQGHLGEAQVVVDGAGDAHAGDALLDQTQRALEGTVAADDDHGVNAQRTQVLRALLLELGLAEIVATGGAQLGAGTVRVVQHGFQVKALQVLLILGGDGQQAVEAALDADALDVAAGGSLHHGGDGRVHARGVAAGGDNGNLFDIHGRIAPSIWGEVCQWRRKVRIATGVQKIVYHKMRHVAREKTGCAGGGSRGAKNFFGNPF